MTSDEGRIERRIRQIGGEILARARRAEPSAVRMGWWQQFALDWLMRDEALKVQLFRFIESLPRLRSADAVAAHLRQYLRDGRRNGRPLPGLVDLATGYASDGSFHARLVALAARAGALRMARQFIAGSTPDEAIAAVRRLRREGMTFTLDVLGETVLCAADADHYERTYLELIDVLSASAAAWPGDALLDDSPFGAQPRVNLSIKLSALAPKFDAIASERVGAAVLARLRRVLGRARERGVFVNVDLEHYAVRDLTYDIFFEAACGPELRDWPHLGVVIQAYLRDSDRDCDRVLEAVARRGTPLTVRLVKGAYWDQETAQAMARVWPIPVWTEKWQSDAQYERLARRLLENHERVRPAFASHNVRSLAAALAIAEQLAVPRGTLEVQMLYGMGDALKRALVGMGERVRVYTPFGELMPGMAYFMRRLLENTANESFLRMSFSEHAAPDRLLAAPRPSPGARSALPATVRCGPDEDETTMPFQNEPQTDFSQATARARMSAALAAARAKGERRHGLLIDGQERESGEWFAQPNPSCAAETVFRVALAGPGDVARAVSAAEQCASAWAGQAVEGRAAILIACAERLARQRWELAAELVRGCGMTWRTADAEVAATVDALRYGAREAEHLLGQPRRRDVPGETNTYVYQPRGPVALLTSVCQPLAGPAHVMAAALAAGNPVVVCPAPETAGVCAYLVRQVLEHSLPGGVLQFVCGASAGLELAGDARVRVVAVDGREGLVKRVLNASAASAAADGRVPPRVVAEIVGTGTVIVDDDTDVDEAVLGILTSAFSYSGQGAANCARVVVVEAAYASLVERLAAAAAEMSVGPADDPAVSMGPLISREAVESMRSAADRARRMARAVVERDHAELHRRTGGHFFGPVVFVDVPARADILADAGGGPLLAVMRAENLDQAIELAQDADGTAACAVYSRSPANLDRVRRDLRAGLLCLNRPTSGVMADRQPFGGGGAAGPGRPRGGPDFIREFLDARVVSENVVRHGLVPLEAPEAMEAAAHG